MFDFSGTLFRFTERAEWFTHLRDGSGNPIQGHTQAELIRRMTAPVGIPVDLDDEGRYAWQRRDLDPALHRQAYLAVLRGSGLTLPGHAESLYERVIDPQSWEPYPDTARCLRALRSAGIGVGVVSNIAFDLRDVFEVHDMGGLVDTFTLSYEVGITKPDPVIFASALRSLGVAGPGALMVGDSEEADGGARRVGCDFTLVQPVPVPQRPRALLDAVAHLLD
ncbi:HAD-IA family hydrolase [Williamsia sp. 1135]|uniref:HAD family hydrolase n=1 Tax=Williamsia sp. 1135 TaxID=1889262 RepID=UPI001F0B05DC|nr:HAD-IA family hydrolase [Williamsia sp. 1135]